MSLTMFLIGYIICGLVLFLIVMGIYRYFDDEKTTTYDVERAIWCYGCCWPLGFVYIVLLLLVDGFKKITKGKLDAFVKFMNKGK